MRACEYFLAGRCGLSAESLANLLRSDAGLTILENIMGAGAPAWWGSFRRQAEIGRLRREQSALRERIEKLTE